MTPAPRPAPDPTAARRLYEFCTRWGGSIVAIVIIDTWLVRQPLAPGLGETMTASDWRALAVLGLWLGVAGMAWLLARSRRAPAIGYTGLVLFLAAAAVLLVNFLSGTGEFSPGAVQTAALMTVLLVGGLTAAPWVAPRAFRLPPRVIVHYAELLYPLFTHVTVSLVAIGSIFGEYWLEYVTTTSLSLFADVLLTFWFVLVALEHCAKLGDGGGGGVSSE